MADRPDRRAIFARVRAATVAIAAAPDVLPQKPVDPPDPIGSLEGILPIRVIGSGVLLHEAGIVVTAAHVLDRHLRLLESFQRGELPNQPDAPKFMFRTSPRASDGKIGFLGFMPMQVIQHAEADLAVVRLAGPVDRLPAALDGRSEHAREGDEVVVAGFPFGLEYQPTMNITFTSGIVSSAPPHDELPVQEHREFMLDAVVNPGNSGGPVVDVHTGEVVGIITASTAFESGEGTVVELRLARALPIYWAFDLIRAILEE